MKIALDTNAYAKLMCNHKPLVECVEDAHAVFGPVTVIGELLAGFRLGSRRQENCAKLNEFLAVRGVTVLTTNRDVAERYAMLVQHLRQKGTPLPTNDVWIAAAVLETGARLITYDSHFGRIPGLALLSP